MSKSIIHPPQEFQRAFTEFRKCFISSVVKYCPKCGQTSLWYNCKGFFCMNCEMFIDIYIRPESVFDADLAKALRKEIEE